MMNPTPIQPAAQAPEETPGHPALYPVFFKLAGRPVLVVGGGALALQKVETLLPAGAQVTVAALAIGPALKALEGRHLTLLETAYQSGLMRARPWALVFAATQDPAVNRRVVAEAAALNIPANAVDRPELCGFYTPSVIRRGAATLAISTGGGFPGLARALRRTLEAWLPPQDDELLEGLGRLRRALIQSGLAAGERQAVLKRLAQNLEQDYLAPRPKGAQPLPKTQAAQA